MVQKLRSLFLLAVLSNTAQFGLPLAMATGKELNELSPNSCSQPSTRHSYGLLLASSRTGTREQAASTSPGGMHLENNGPIAGDSVPVSSTSGTTGNAAAVTGSGTAGNATTVTENCAVTGSADGNPATTSNTSKVLQGTISATGKPSLLLQGSVQSLPAGTTLDVTIMGNLNSELSKKGDEVYVQVSHDIAGANGVAVPGGWYMHGTVTNASGQKRHGRDGFVEVEFDQLVSPDNDLELPFHAVISTKDKLMKTVAKTIVRDSAFVGAGAVNGAIASIQIGGVPLAVATQGYSVAIGAGAGAAIGTIAALKNKGKIQSLYPGDSMRLVTAEPISLPGFNSIALPSAAKPATLSNLLLTVNRAGFSKDPNGDKQSSLLTLDVTMQNKTAKEFRFTDLAVISDHNRCYYPSLYGGLQSLKKKVKPNSTEVTTLTFSVDGKRHKYWLVLLDKARQDQLSRVPIN